MCIDTRYSYGMSHITECLELTDYAEVANLRDDLADGLGEIWDITTPAETATIRIAEDDGQIYIYVFEGHINAGQMTFSRNLAAPAYIAAAIDQIVQDYL